jgi:hypothetical protein
MVRRRGVARARRSIRPDLSRGYPPRTLRIEGNGTRRFEMRIGLVVSGLIAVVIGLAGLGPLRSGTPGTSVASAASVHTLTDRSGKASAPCTKRALEAGMRRAHSHARIVSKRAFGCARGFAYAFAIVGSGPSSFEENLLFRAAGRRWNVVSRAKYCKKPVVPERIKKAVCNSS